MIPTRRKLISLICLFALFTLGLSSIHAQDSVLEIGVAPTGQDALELIGEIDQNGFNLTAYGYVTFANGLDPAALFAPDTLPMFRDEAHARLTYMGTGEGVSRSVHQNIFSSVLTAEITFYWNDTPAGASFDSPESFAAGVPVATLTMRLHSVLNVQEPNIGVFMTFGDSVQNSAGEFTIDGVPVRLGHSGLDERFTFFGQGFRSSQEPLLAQYLFSANAVVTDSQMTSY